MKSFVAVPMLLALCAPAFAAEQAASTVAIDPKTGELRAPTAAELAELEAEAARMEQAQRLEKSAKPRRGMPVYQAPKTEAEALKTLTHRADGLVSVEVPESMHSRVIATVGEDGEVVITHEGHEEGHAHE